jgi:FtsH-binding integral membrane protein
LTHPKNRELSSKVPVNYLLLFAFTLCLSIVVTIIVAPYDKDTVIFAGLVTLTMVVMLTLIAIFCDVSVVYCGVLVIAGMLDIADGIIFSVDWVAKIL